MKTNIPFWKTLQAKYFVAIFLAVAAFLGVLGVLSSSITSHNTGIYNDRVTERQDSFDIISKLDSQPLRGLTIENTYWDDMVNYIQHPNADFENTILKVQLSSSLYNASAIWTYNTNYKLVSNTNEFPANLSTYNLNLTSTQIKHMFASDYLVHFYRITPVGIMEIYGATVHESTDVAHKSTPKGYFYIAKLLDSAYAASLSKETKDNVTLQTMGSRKTSEAPPNPSSGYIVFYKDLQDETGAKIARFKVQYYSAAIAVLFQSFSKIVQIATISLLVLSILVFVLLERLIIRPLNYVHHSLLTDDTTHLNDLTTKDTELGRIAALILKAQQQKAEIEANIILTKKAQSTLEERTHELEAANALMINRELRMSELKAENERLKRSDK